MWALSFFLLLLLVGFPGTPLFFAKVLFLTLLWPYSLFLVFFFSFVFLLLIPLFLFRVWGSMWVGQPSGEGFRVLDLSSQELCLALVLIAGAMLLGFFPLVGLTSL